MPPAKVGGRCDPRLQTALWRKVRKLVLARDHWRCGYCGDVATTVDHIIERQDGGAMYDLANLVACCEACQHKGIRAQRQWLLSRVTSERRPVNGVLIERITGDLSKRER